MPGNPKRRKKKVSRRSVRVPLEVMRAEDKHLHRWQQHNASHGMNPSSGAPAAESGTDGFS